MNLAVPIFLIVLAYAVMIQPAPTPGRPAAGTAPTGSPPASSQPAATQPSATQPATERLMIAGEGFDLELAIDAESRERGLMGRTEIARNGGMLFVHPEPSLLSYWMKHCKVDMDIVYLDAGGRIVQTYTMKPEPPRREDESEAAYESRLTSYPSRRFAQFVIELKAGTVRRLKLNPGARIDADWPRLRRLAR